MLYRSEIDGLRAVAVLPVIFFHAGFELFSGGFVGVDVFFVISGYLITTIILTELQQNQFSLISFYERRARRILPALFLVMAACLPFAWFLLLPGDMLSFSQSLLSVSVFLSNLFFWSERGYFGTAIELKPLIHTWSLAIEEQYYLVFPLLLILFNKIKLQLYLKAGLLLLLCISSLILCIWLSKVHMDSAFYLLPTRLWELMLGSLTAMLCLYKSGQSEPWIKRKSVLECVGLACIFYSVFFFDKNTLFPGYAALLPATGTALIILCSTGQSLVGKMLSARVLVGIGLISYSVYLWHQPVFAFARHFYQLPISPAGFLLLILLTLVLSWCSWRYVEQRFRDKQKYSRQNIFKLSVLGLVLFSCLGIVGWKSNGLLFRFAAQEQQLLKNFVNADSYITGRFDRLQLVDFADGTIKKKILIIGDSYAKDLVNALAESSLYKQLDISTYQINSNCGNLYLDTDFATQIQHQDRARCEAMGWYENARLRELIQKSDAIWLSSMWVEWVAPLVGQSVKKLEADFGKKVLVFGSKKFGAVDQKSLVAMSLQQRLALRNKLSVKHFTVQQIMRQSLPKQQFVDLSQLLCRSDQYCKVFTEQGLLISHDGAHLSRDGARYLGSLLEQHPLIQQFLASEP